MRRYYVLDRVVLALAVSPRSGFEAHDKYYNSIDEGTRTPFGLYRDGTELRAVYYDKPEVAHAACDSMGDQCDYPILLGKPKCVCGNNGVTFSQVMTRSTVVRSRPARHT